MKRSVLLCLFLALTASSETVKFNTLPRPIIEKRLAAFAGSNADRQRTLSDLFTEAGCPGDALVEQIVNKKKPPNVVCTVAGQIDSTIVVGAHFDFVKEGKGVVDNWSGASLLPSLLQSLNGIPRRHTFIFIGFTDEELGLVGSHYYVRQLPKEQLRKIAAMVNMDSLGTGTTRFETVRSDKSLIKALASVAASVKLPISIVNAHEVGRSDSDSFQDKKVPTINFHSLTNETISILHSPRDHMDAIRMDEYYDSYRLIAAYLAYLDLTLDPPR